MTLRRASLLLVLPLAALGTSSSIHGDGGSAGPAKDVTVSLCDGESVMTLPGLKPGQELPPPEARRVASQMMQVWRQSQGEARWAAWTADTAAPSVSR